MLFQVSSDLNRFCQGRIGLGMVGNVRRGYFWSGQVKTGQATLLQVMSC